MHKRPSPLDLGNPALLRNETEQGLGVEPRLLLDPAFVARTHQRLRDSLPRNEARALLRRAGFRHGLRDALALMRDGLRDQPTRTGAPTPTRLAVHLTRSAPPLPDTNATAEGTWPLGWEARACRDQQLEHLGCELSRGYTAGWLSGLWERDVVVVETHCEARGDASCRFSAREADSEGEIPFEALRVAIAEEIPPPARDALPDSFDPNAPVIHVWGPVMVVPFSGGDESVHGVELIGCEPGARDVRVVVIDMTGAALDDAFGALALERVLDAVETWSAEAILAGVGPLSQQVVADLERHTPLIEKDVPQAIAVAFQVADAQRCPA